MLNRRSFLVLLPSIFLVRPEPKPEPINELLGVRSGRFMSATLDGVPDWDQFMGNPTAEAMGEAAARGRELVKRNPVLAKLGRWYGGGDA